MLKKFNMEDCIPISTTMEIGLNLPKNDKLELEQQTKEPYRELINCLLYLMLNSRPAISAAVNYLSRFINCATDTHWKHMKRILRYLKGTLEYKLVYNKQRASKSEITGYADADRASDSIDRKSVSGYLCQLFGNTISWTTRKQATVSLSSTEAEYVVVTQATCEIRWIQSILDELQNPYKKPTIICEDNQGCIEIAKHPQDHKRMKHVDVKFHFIKETI